MFGPDLAGTGHTGIQGSDGEITGLGGAKVAIIARWNIRRSGSYPDGRPKLRFRAWFSWRNDVLLGMCQKGLMKPRIRVFMRTESHGKQQIDIVNWDEFTFDQDNNLIVENIVHFDTAPLTASGS